jgi:SAM-dependent methyltransferase
MSRLHFGCFNCPLDGWVNTDVTPHLRVAKIPGLSWLMHKLGLMSDERYEEHRKNIFKNIQYLNVTKPWSFQDGNFEAIYSSHVLEHLPLRGAKVCLAECYRCLKSGGVLRISVPDLDAFVRDFDPTQSMDWATKLFEANESSEKNMHHFMYNFVSLQTLLKSVGFSQVTRRDFQEGICPDVEKLDNRPGSLFVEAFK